MSSIRNGFLPVADARKHQTDYFSAPCSIEVRSIDQATVTTEVSDVTYLNEFRHGGEQGCVEGGKRASKPRRKMYQVSSGCERLNSVAEERDAISPRNQFDPIDVTRIETDVLLDDPIDVTAVDDVHETFDPIEGAEDVDTALNSHDIDAYKQSTLLKKVKRNREILEAKAQRLLRKPVQMPLPVSAVSARHEIKSSQNSVLADGSTKEDDELEILLKSSPLEMIANAGRQAKQERQEAKEETRERNEKVKRSPPTPGSKEMPRKSAPPTPESKEMPRKRSPPTRETHDSSSQPPVKTSTSLPRGSRSFRKWSQKKRATKDPESATDSIANALQKFRKDAEGASASNANPLLRVTEKVSEEGSLIIDTTEIDEDDLQMIQAEQTNFQEDVQIPPKRKDSKRKDLKKKDTKKKIGMTVSTRNMSRVKRNDDDLSEHFKDFLMFYVRGMQSLASNASAKVLETGHDLKEELNEKWNEKLPEVQKKLSEANTTVQDSLRQLPSTVQDSINKIPSLVSDEELDDMLHALEKGMGERSFTVPPEEDEERETLATFLDENVAEPVRRTRSLPCSTYGISFPRQGKKEVDVVDVPNQEFIVPVNTNSSLSDD